MTMEECDAVVPVLIQQAHLTQIADSTPELLSRQLHTAQSQAAYYASSALVQLSLALAESAKLSARSLVIREDFGSLVTFCRTVVAELLACAARHDLAPEFTWQQYRALAYEILRATDTEYPDCLRVSQMIETLCTSWKEQAVSQAAAL